VRGRQSPRQPPRHVGQLSLASVLVAKSTSSFAGGTAGNVTSAGWQVTLCDPIWYASCRSGEACCELIYPITLRYISPDSQRGEPDVDRKSDDDDVAPPGGGGDELAGDTGGLVMQNTIRLMLPGESRTDARRLKPWRKQLSHSQQPSLAKAALKIQK